MRFSTNWNDYEIIDVSKGERLERWGEVILVRPDPQVIWDTPRQNPLWQSPHARYLRSTQGGGHWETFKALPAKWNIQYKNLTFQVSPTNFKHTGLFPEQATNWDFLAQRIKQADRPLSVLNLFAYTGGATIACAKAGAKVCHVDASRGMVSWARENADLSGVPQDRVRYIVDDCQKFVEREIRRGNRYDIVIMDPPSYGRGPSGEIWKLEDSIYGLVTSVAKVLCDKPEAFLLNSYTTGLAPSVMLYLIGASVGKRFGGQLMADEIGLPVKESGLIMPAGQTAMWLAQ